LPPATLASVSPPLFSPAIDPESSGCFFRCANDDINFHKSDSVYSRLQLLSSVIVFLWTCSSFIYTLQWLAVTGGFGWINESKHLVITEATTSGGERVMHHEISTALLFIDFQCATVPRAVQR